MTAAPEVLTVDVEPDRPARDQQLAVLESLPRHFRITPGGPADVLLVSAALPGWPDRLTLAGERGLRGVLLAGPAFAAAERVPDTLGELDSAGTAVVVDLRFGYDAGWRSALPSISDAVTTSAIVDCITHGGNARPALAEGPAPSSDDVLQSLVLSQLSLLGSVLPASTGFELAHRSDAQYAVCGQIGDTVVNLVGATYLPSAPSLRLHVASLERRWEAVFDEPAVATPTTITRADAGGTMTLPLGYEGSRRAAWRALHRAVTEGAPIPYGLPELLRDQQTAARLLP